MALAIADVELDEPPKPDEVLEIPGGGKMRVYGIAEGDDGSPVIKAECKRRDACRRLRR